MDQKWCFFLAGIFSLLLLGGCKTDLYTQIEEDEANEMLAILLEHNIPAAKVPVKDTIVSLQVESAYIADAVEVLNAKGYPKRSYETIGQLFQKSGLISSPTEERIRYIYGISQELSEAISSIDGVIKAFVHVVVPERRPGVTTVSPATAAVLIKYNPNYDLESRISQIKLLVSNSVERLKYDNVSVVLFPVKLTPVSSDIASLSQKNHGLSSMHLVIAFISGILLLFVVGVAIYFFLPKLKGRSERQE